MDFDNAKPRNAARWAWARTAALILFAVTGILFLASLHSARSQAPTADMGSSSDGTTTIETR